MKRLTPEEREERAKRALMRAQTPLGKGANDALIRMVWPGCNPRTDVLTFAAWRAVGRTVRKGEHGYPLTVYSKPPSIDDGEKAEKSKCKRYTAYVFHVSQTDPLS